MLTGTQSHLKKHHAPVTDGCNAVSGESCRGTKPRVETRRLSLNEISEGGETTLLIHHYSS